MSLELIAILMTAAFQSACLVAIIVMLYRNFRQINGVAAATFLQGRRIEDVIKETHAIMRESLRSK